MHQNLQRHFFSKGIWCLLYFLWCLCSECKAVQEYPKVSVLRWMTAESSDWEYDNLTSDTVSIKETDRETIYTVGQHLLAVSIVCNASYPVKWAFHHYDRTGMYNIRIRTYRQTGEDMFDTKSYKFSATLDMYSDLNKLTGGYSCHSTVSNRIKNDIYVYALGNSPPYLVYAGQTMTIKSEDNKTMTLPCIVSSPDTQVALYKRIANDFMLEPPSPYIDWDPQVGYTLNMPQMDDPFGSYKCLVTGGDEDDDYVLLTAVPGIETKNRQNNILQGNASFSYDPVLRQIKCCATGTRAPNMRNIYCEDPITCELREVYVMQNGNNGIKFKNSSCTVDRIYYRDSGVFRCKGDGIDVVRHFFSGYGNQEVNETSPLYFSWHEADPSKLMDIVQHYRPVSGKIYSNQTFYMSCDTSYYYFSEGVHWALKWRNKTIQYLNETFTAYQGSYRRSESMKTIKLVADVEMEQLVCYAPVWNTTDWGIKTFDLKIYQSVAPEIVGPVMEEFRYSLNQTNVTIFCMAENGRPTPIIRWRKSNRVVLSDANIMVRRSNGSSSITFKRLTHDNQGDYKCLVGNVAGRTSKTVRVIINVSGSSWGAASISITVIVVLALLGGMGFLVWKMKLQKKIIDHLAGVVFRDMSGTQSTSTQANGR